MTTDMKRVGFWDKKVIFEKHRWIYYIISDVRSPR